MIDSMPARIFKPKALVMCKHCNEVGHFASDPKCAAKAPAAMADLVDAFHGESNPLLNLHCCPEGCVLPDGQYNFPSAEHHYQFGCLCFHDMVNKLFCVLEAQSGLEAMRIAHCALPHDQEKPEW